MAEGAPSPNKTPPKSPLEDDTRRLANNGGEAFDRFLRTFGAFVDTVTVAVTDAPSDQILRLQGQAQMARKLLRMFTEARH
jgi:hypothetical protein